MRTLPSLCAAPAGRAAALLSLVVAAGGCNPSESAAKGPAEEKPVPVTVVSVKPGTVREILELSADCEAAEEAEVRSRVGGPVTAVHVAEGQNVAAGDVLVELDRADADLAVRKAEASLELARLAVKEKDSGIKVAEQARATAELSERHARTEYERVRSLSEGGVGAVSEDVIAAKRFDYDQAVCRKQSAEVDFETAQVAAEVARSKVHDAELVVEEAKLSLTYRAIRAPFSGQVVRFDLHVGDYVIMGSVVARIENAERLFARFEVAQADVRKVKVGQVVSITTQALPGRPFAGRVDAVNRGVDRERGTVRVRVSIDHGGELMPGLFVVGRIVLQERRDVPVLPREAIRFERARPYVWYIDPEGAARRLEIELGLTDNEVCEIVSFPDRQSPPERIILLGSVKEGKAVYVNDDGKPADGGETSAAAG